MVGYYRAYRVLVGLAALHSVAAPSTLKAQPAPPVEGYQVPDADIRAVLEAEPTPDVQVAPGGKWLLLTRRSALLSIDRVARFDFGLLGVDPVTRVPKGDYYGVGTGMTLVRVADGKRWELPVPSGHLGAPVWSPDGRHFLIRHADAQGLWLMVGDVESRAIRRVDAFRLTDERVGIAPCAWLADSSGAICKTVADDPGPVPARADGPRQPRIAETSAKPSVVPNFTGRLRDADDERLYRYVRTAQLRRLDLATMAVTPVGEPGLYDYFSVSPDGRYLFTARTVAPYSRTSFQLEFPKRFAVLGLEDGVAHPLAERAEVRWATATKYGGAAPGPRHFTWRPDAPATLVYVEANAEAEADKGDRLMRWEAPFAHAPAELFRTKGRMFNADDYLRRYTPVQSFANLVWLPRGRLWIEERDTATRRKRAWLVDAAGGPVPPAPVFDLDLGTALPDPGSILPVGGRGSSASVWAPWFGFYEPQAVRHGEDLLLAGFDPGREGRGFVDALDPATGARRRLFLSASIRREEPVALLDGDALLLLTQSQDAPPNYVIADLRGGGRRPVTSIRPALAKLNRIKARDVMYSRADGVKLRGKLILPADYAPGSRVPVVMWGYPDTHASREPAGGAFTAQENAGGEHAYSWAQMASPPLLAEVAALRGYAVFLMPMPIIGDPHPNDTAVTQMMANAKAAVDVLDAMGVADRKRIAIMGHSYGGEMVATLLTRSHLFAAGIAINGFVNPLKSPGGFQDEPRTLWQSRDAYLDLTPLFGANKLSAPLLLIHGEADNNPGTPLIDTERFFDALNTLGRPARLVVLPGEGHSPLARESILHAAWEIDRWLDIHLRDDEAGAKGETGTRQ